MSIEKLSNESCLIIEQNPFAQISNQVINHIKDNNAFRLYCYLYSKSQDWKVVKSYARKMCHISEAKAKKCWSYLARCNLIKYQKIRDEQGKILKYNLIVLNGTKFDKDEPFIKPIIETGNDQSNDQSSENVSHGKTTKNCSSHPLVRKLIQVENDPLLNKDIYKKNKKTKNTCASPDALMRFEDFWNSYPIKKSKLMAKKSWAKQKLGNKADEIIEAVERFKASDSQWLAGYIPHPSTFLNQCRWEDEVKQWPAKTVQEVKQSTAMEVPSKDGLCHALVRANALKEFTHPIVFLLFKLIGSYALKNNTEFDIKQKINMYYKDVCNEYTSDPFLAKKKMRYFIEHGEFMKDDSLIANTMANALRSNFVGGNMAGQ